MKVMYIDCGMGAAGDMLTAALLELIPDREDLVRELNGIWRDGVETVAKSAKRCGIRGTLVDVLVDGRQKERCTIMTMYMPLFLMLCQLYRE